MEAFLPLQLRPAVPKITGMGIKKFASRFLAVVMSGTIPFSVFGFLDPGILAMGERTPYIQYGFKAYATS